MGIWLKHCYVYLVGYVDDSSSPVKIGISGDLESRLKSLQTSNPNELEIRYEIGPFPRKEATHIEYKIHRRLRRYRIRGEWFDTKCQKKFYELVSLFVDDIYLD